MKKNNGGGMMAMGLVALVLIGVAVWYFFFRVKKGCMTPGYKEYNEKYEEDTDPTGCTTQLGCTTSGFTEYDVKYGEDTDPTSCVIEVVTGCTDPDYQEYNVANPANTSAALGTTNACTIKMGCMEDEDVNYDVNAGVDTTPTSCAGSV